MHIPFPPKIAEISRANAEAASKRSAGTHTVKDLAAYRLSDGTLRTAYDLYVPEYPEGSTPGLCDVEYRLRHYPNDTSGYDASVFNFRPAADLLNDAPDWENPCLAVLQDDSFVIARTEAELALALADQAGVRRVSVRSFGLDGSEPPGVILMLPKAPGLLAFAGKTASDLISPLEKRFARTIEGDDPRQAILDLLEPARVNGVKWLLAEGADIDIALEHGPGPSILEP